MIKSGVRAHVGAPDNKPLPAFAWPGGYPIYYLCADNGVLCPDCANGKNGSLAMDAEADDEQWTVIAADIHWEGPPLDCDHCGVEIESAYGDPEENEPCRH